MVVRGRARAAGAAAAAVALVSVGALAAPAQAGHDGEDRPGPPERVSVREFAKDVDVDAVLEHLDELQDLAEAHGGNRASGLPGYEASVAYVVEELTDAGYEPVVQTFEFPFYQELGSTFARVSPTATEYVAGTDYDLFEYSGSGVAEAVVVPVDLALEPPRASSSGCEPGDFLDPDGQSRVAGAIALVQRGQCPFGTKVANAEAAGAVGVVVMNQGNEGAPGDDRLGVVTGTLGAPAGIPAVSVSFGLGAELAGTPGTTLRLTADTRSDVRTTQNVVAETARGSRDTVVMAGAHLDSVQEGAGINDNGTGSAALLEIALELADDDVRHTNAVRFAWWGAEESGLLGSTHYAAVLPEAEAARIALYLNFDMIGSPNYVLGVLDGDDSGGTAPEGFIPPGSAEIEDLFRSLLEARGEGAVDAAFTGRSDYGPFVALGIPSGGLFTGAEGVKTPEEAHLFGGLAGVAYDPCYHQRCDDLEGDHLPAYPYRELGDGGDLIGNVNEHALEVNTAVIASAVLTLARDASAVTDAATP